MTRTSSPIPHVTKATHHLKNEGAWEDGVSLAITGMAITLEARSSASPNWNQVIPPAIQDLGGILSSKMGYVDAVEAMKAVRLAPACLMCMAFQSMRMCTCAVQPHARSAVMLVPMRMCIARCSLLVRAALEEAQVDEVQRREDASFLLCVRLRREVDSVIVVGHAGPADAPDVAAGPVTFKGADLLTRACNLDGHDEHRVETRRGATIAATVPASQGHLDLEFFGGERVEDGKPPVRADRHRTRPFHFGTAQRRLGRHVLYRHLLRVEEAAAAAHRAAEWAVKLQHGHLALWPAVPSQTSFPVTIARLTTTRREVAKLQLSGLVEAVAAETRGLLAHLKDARRER
eukprot:CAMPEP_0174699112 /NCGR_PEP_ID=MMETSP1094-20130205/4498_1 /TAXON_ID=156173 /ORGANISM="Chrysochromulina brevifilum, Strain UTEX LB 985" /LENGTH=345 /DNA_ID=CAMNT_0015896389 /DNA_START=372 /DNA_END=1412 /DNA_ORIENTATION=-